MAHNPFPFELSTYLQAASERLHTTDEKPIIGITANYREGQVCLCEHYYLQVVEAGGIPVMIPPVADDRIIEETLETIDALLLSGGGDINPLWLGEQPSPQLHSINHRRDLPELMITRLAFQRQIPILAICRGIQTLAAALGGKIIQDLGEEWSHRRALSDTVPSLLKHSQECEQATPTHTVTIVPDTILDSVYGQTGTICVNSLHHQAVADGGKHLRISATAPDGVIEAIESCEDKAILGVQWHPEWLGEEGRKLFAWLVDEGNCFRRAKRFHQKHITLDSHCDTPMFFHQGIDFTKRDNRILVDIPKMTDGRLDAVTMVAYLPQPKTDRPFRESISLDIDRPFDYANFIFDRIEALVATDKERVAIARTPQDIEQNKRLRRKSILLGIENGLALEGQTGHVAHFASRGITYITLCHNGDNDLCDSARGQNTHGGVSRLGVEVIEEMNRQGIIVDLSHGAEKSFYDAIDISRQPIVCSHSCCKALCDHPRNLDDAQMRTLAKNDGVMQITLYAGFLRQTGETDIRDAVAHLQHAIDIMGIEHVGLGTDFDGDGGIRGLADASEMIQFTRRLLLEHYTEQDISMIWGGNWLRLMDRIQAARQTQTS
ncbi:MAG: membrane dipeptidase [Prevotella sp.]|nr:membrane dipeptidase [Prevotella sp.]